MKHYYVSQMPLLELHPKRRLAQIHLARKRQGQGASIPESKFGSYHTAFVQRVVKSSPEHGRQWRIRDNRNLFGRYLRVQNCGIGRALDGATVLRSANQEKARTARAFRAKFREEALPRSML